VQLDVVIANAASSSAAVIELSLNISQFIFYMKI